MKIFRVVFLICLHQLTIGEMIAQNSSLSMEKLNDMSDIIEKSGGSASCSVFIVIIGRLLNWLTDGDDYLRVRFFLSSRIQRNRVEVLESEKFDLKGTDFKIERRTVFIVHGFLSNSSAGWIKEMEDALLLWGDVNVVMVDWHIGVNNINFQSAVYSVAKIGIEISRFLQHVVNATIDGKSTKKPNWGILHLVGHSLGAHICGIAGADFNKNQNHWQVTRITGLDPAGPCFDDVSFDRRLDSTDAKFVDVIHTSDSTDLLLGFGIDQPIGHVDFYPNGGKKQPGCGSILKPITKGICNHERAHVYFTESLMLDGNKQECKFWARPWNRSADDDIKPSSDHCDPSICTEMGIEAENYMKKVGTFSLTTASSPPFCVMEKKDNVDSRINVGSDPSIGSNDVSTPIGSNDVSPHQSYQSYSYESHIELTFKYRVKK